jgi:acyl-CoA reductase-like NAD-dependent aldehyde dehydrogenase
MTLFDETIFNRARARVEAYNGHFINGAWVRGEGAIRAGPGERGPIGAIAAGGAREVDEAVSAARAARHPEWSAMPAAGRERLLLRLAEPIEAEADEIAAIETLDNGMPYAVSRMMAVGSAISAVRYHAGWPRRLTGERADVGPRQLARLYHA